MTRLRMLVAAGFLVVSASLQAADLHLTPDPLPGFYTESQTLTLDVPPNVKAEYRFLEDVDGGFIPWKFPLLLSALPGETRNYTMRLLTTQANGESLTKDFRYTVARDAPARPTVRPAPGYSARPIVVDAQLPPGMTVTLGGLPVQFPLSLEGAAGELRSYRLEVSGVRGTDDGETWVYSIDRRGQGAVGLEILSPIAGTWANSQWLVITQQGLDAVAWCWGESWNEAAAYAYSGPVRLEANGASVLTVHAQVKGSGAELTRTVRWSQGNESLTAWGLVDSGVSVSPLKIPPVSGMETSLDEGRTWRPMTEERNENLVDQSLKVVTAQYRKVGVSATSRTVYWMDGRTPVVPKVEFWGGWNPRLSAIGSTDSVFTVEWLFPGGKTAGSESLWGPSASWKIPDGCVGASVAARAPNGRVARSESLGFPAVGWIRPEWTPWESGGGQVAPRPGFRAVYEVRSDRDVPEPTAASPTLTGPFLPSVPLGVDRTFFVRLAWKDASGVVGPSTSVIAVHVDHLAPQPPRVSFSRRLVKIEPSDTEPGARLFYAMTSTKMSAVDTPIWLPYQGTIDLDLLAVSAVPQWIHALVVDAAGNPGTPRLNFPLGTGAAAYEWKGLTFQDPARGLTGALPDGAVVPAARVLIQPSWDGDLTGVWSLSSSTPTLPTDWEKSLTLVDRPIPFSGNPGERKTFYTWWNLRNSTGWVWDKPRLISFVLEQGPPASPVVKGLEPPLTRSQAWTVSAVVGQPGDRLSYSVTVDGREAPDPTGSRSLDWPGSVSWDTPEGTRTEIHFRLAVTSAAGVAREIPWDKALVIDRTIPAALPPVAEPFRSFRSPARLELGPYKARVHYTVTQDGSLPPTPTVDSPRLTTGFLEFPGTVGQQTLYRVRLRPFSEALQPGPVSDSIAILVDLTQTPERGQARQGLGEGLQVDGLPESGMSSKPVSLTISSPWGTPRFELAEGPVQSKPVEVTSPAISGPLFLAGAEGADRSYTLTVRSFSDEGDPLTPEAKWTLRIDRSPPQAPTLSLESDPRRPEAIIRTNSSSLSDDEHLFVRWSWSSFPSGAGASDWSEMTGEVPRFSAPEDRLTTLSVEAQVRDDAGNLGPIHKETILLDRNVVYASAQAPGTGTGTRSDPAGNLAVALAKMRSEGRKVLVMTSGTYTLAEAQDWTGFEVWGGLKAGTWESTPTPGRSTLAPAPGKKLTRLLEVYGPLALHRLDFTDAGEPLANLVSAQSSEVTLEDSTWQTKATVVPWRQVGGHLKIRSATAVWDGTKEGSLFLLEDVRFQVQDARWTVLSATNPRTLVLLRSQTVLSGVTFVSRLGTGLDTFLWAQNGDLAANDLRITAGDGSASSTAFVLDGTNTTMVNVEVNLSATRANTGLQVNAGQLDLQKLRQTITKGSEYNVGMRLLNADVRLQEGFLQLDAGSYQGGISQNGGSLVLATMRVSLVGGGQLAWGIQTLGACRNQLSDVSWVLAQKTNGQPVMAQQQWTEGSFNRDSRATGWSP